MNWIEEPSREEKEQAIARILALGLTKPKSIWRHLRDMYRALGFRHLFLHTAYPVLISAALMIGFILMIPLPFDQYRNAILFAAAPVFFIFAVLLTETAERMSGLFDLKMTCKYTVQQIAAFRVLCFSLIGTVLCTLAIPFSGFPDTRGSLRALASSLCALYLFSFISISFMRHFHRKWLRPVPVLLWLAAGPCPIRIFGREWELFLARMPAAVTVTIAAAALVLFLREIQKLANAQRREVHGYAGC